MNNKSYEAFLERYIGNLTNVIEQQKKEIERLHRGKKLKKDPVELEDWVNFLFKVQTGEMSCRFAAKKILKLIK